MTAINNSAVTFAEFCETANKVAHDLSDVVEAKRKSGSNASLQRDLVIVETFNRLGIDLVHTVDGKSKSTAGTAIPVDFGALFSVLAAQGVFPDFEVKRGAGGGVIRKNTSDEVAVKAKAAATRAKMSARERLSTLNG